MESCRNAILIHGTGGTPEKFWFPYVRRHLVNLGFSVWVPPVPNSEKPKLETSLELFLKEGLFVEETVMIGHSSGCPTILSILERIDVRIAHAILVAGFYSELDDDGYSSLMLQPEYDWDKIKSNAETITIINSDNDPWGCGDIEAKPAVEALAAKQIVIPGAGHMGSDAFEQPYEEFPLLTSLIS